VAATGEAAGRGEAVGRGLTAAGAVAAIYRSVYSCSSLNGANAHQHAYLLGPKSHAEAAQPYAGGGGIEEWRRPGADMAAAAAAAVVMVVVVVEEEQEQEQTM